MGAGDQDLEHGRGLLVNVLIQSVTCEHLLGARVSQGVPRQAQGAATASRRPLRPRIRSHLLSCQVLWPPQGTQLGNFLTSDFPVQTAGFGSGWGLRQSQGLWPPGFCLHPEPSWEVAQLCVEGCTCTKGSDSVTVIGIILRLGQAFNCGGDSLWLGHFFLFVQSQLPIKGLETMVLTFAVPAPHRGCVTL